MQQAPHYMQQAPAVHAAGATLHAAGTTIACSRHKLHAAGTTLHAADILHFADHKCMRPTKRELIKVTVLSQFDNRLVNGRPYCHPFDMHR